jgi:ElaB/YqjD/DUF883 family membrane-anchored ribosome-binding protein
MTDKKDDTIRSLLLEANELLDSKHSTVDKKKLKDFKERVEIALSFVQKTPRTET